MSREIFKTPSAGDQESGARSSLNSLLKTGTVPEHIAGGRSELRRRLERTSSQQIPIIDRPTISYGFSVDLSRPESA